MKKEKNLQPQDDPLLAREVLEELYPVESR